MWGEFRYTSWKRAIIKIRRVFLLSSNNDVLPSHCTSSQALDEQKKRKAISTFCQSHFKSCFKETMISVHNSISSFLFLPIPWWTARWSTKFIAGNLFNQGKQFSKSTASRVINCFSSCMISKLCGFIFFIPKQPQLRTAHT